MTVIPELHVAPHHPLGVPQPARYADRHHTSNRRPDAKPRNGQRREERGWGEIALLVAGMCAGPWTFWGSAIAQAHGWTSWRLPQGLAIWSIVPGLVTALLLTGGRSAVTGLWRRLAHWRVPPWTLALAAVTPALVGSVTLALAKVGGVPVAMGATTGGASAVVYFTYGVGLWLLTEEAGWRGAILPRLQQHLSPLTASLVLGGIWAAWHVPLLHVPGEHDTGVPLMPFALLVIAASVLITALVNAAGGSVVVAAVFHSAFDAVFAWTGVVGGDHRLLLLAALVMSAAAGLVAVRLRPRRRR